MTNISYSDQLHTSNAHIIALERNLATLLQNLKRQPDGSYVLSPLYEIEVNDAKRLVGIL